MLAVTVVHSFTRDDMRTTMFSQEEQAKEYHKWLYDTFLEEELSQQGQVDVENCVYSEKEGYARIAYTDGENTEFFVSEVEEPREGFHTGKHPLTRPECGRSRDNTVSAETPFGTIVAEVCAESNYPGVCVTLEREGEVLADLLLADYSILDDVLSLRVWSDIMKEDYTHRFDISRNDMAELYRLYGEETRIAADDSGDTPLKKYAVYYAAADGDKTAIRKMTVIAASEQIAERLAEEYMYSAFGILIKNPTTEPPEVSEDGTVTLGGHVYKDALLDLEGKPMEYTVSWLDGRLGGRLVTKTVTASDLGQALNKTYAADSAQENYLTNVKVNGTVLR